MMETRTACLTSEVFLRLVTIIDIKMLLVVYVGFSGVPPEY